MFNTASLNILIVEDEKKIADSLKQGLKNSLVGEMVKMIFVAFGKQVLEFHFVQRVILLIL